MTKQKKTDFFIAGNSKSGTTALHKFLAQHPAICMSHPKEPNFFAKDFCHDQDVGAFTRKSEREYLGFFDDPTGERLWGEASASYLYSKMAAREIYAFNPAAKIIIMLREPVSFLHSYHLQMLKNVPSEGEPVKDFREALALEEERKRGEAIPDACLVPEMLYYSERVRYAEQVERFLNYFEAAQVKIIVYDDFKANNAGVFRDVLHFLDVDPDFKPVFGKHNRGKRLKSKSMQGLLYDLTHGKGLFSHVQPVLKVLIPRVVRRFLIEKAYRTVVFGPKQEIDPTLQARLRARFRSEVKKLGLLIGRNLVEEWRYDVVDKQRQISR